MRVALLFSVLLLSACKESTHAAEPPLVETAVVSDSNSSVDRLELTGAVRARTESDLSFRVAGIIAERFVDRGSSVERGQILARLDTQDLAQSRISAEAAAEAAKLDASAALAEETRLRGLDTAGAIAPLTYENARDRAKAAKARAESALAQAQLARDQASYSLLRAPTSGVVADVLAETGQVIQPGTVIIRIASEGPREAEVSIPETSLSAAKSLALASLYTQGEKSPAVLRELSAVADPVTRTFHARYVLQGAASSAPLGSTVTISLARPSELKGLQVPLGAIVNRTNRPEILVFNPSTSTVASRAIQILRMGSETATVTGDLRAGERIVSMGGFLLKSGDAVRVQTSRERG